MRRIKLVLGVAVVMATMLVAFAAPAMADVDFSDSGSNDDGFSWSPGSVSWSNDDGTFWTWGDDVVLWGDDGSWSDDGFNGWDGTVFFV